MKEICTGIALIALVVFIVNPFQFYMSNSVFMMALFFAVIAFASFGGFILREQPRDERENEHRKFADRIAFLSGAAVLMTGIIVESFKHALNPWLAYALVAMVLGKLVALLWSSVRR